MSGGSSKDRRKWKRAVGKARIKQESNGSIKPPNHAVHSAVPFKVQWYERGLFWGCATSALAIILVVVAATLKDLRWLLIFVFPLAGISSWVICKELRIRLLRWILFSILITGTGFGLWKLYKLNSGTAVNVIPPRPYDLSGDRKSRFEESLGKQTISRATVRVGCDDRDEQSCLAAARFLLAMSEAGWKIEPKQVLRLNQAIPSEGVFLASNDRNAQNYKDLPPHLGFWHQMSPSEVTLYSAFATLAIRLGATNDASLPEGTIGVYFGPEPEEQK